ncbi:hypothetical protein KP509_18G058900 [Ceratopteris richardii]|nr:hypothetical protein KP509_18G058900 [Ceratopteris richardii]
MPENMPMKDFVATGRAMQKRMKRHRRAVDKPGPLVGSFTYLKENVGDFYLTISVGSPPQHLIFTLDTGSELTWTQCKPCKVCGASGGPVFSFNKSSSYVPVPCKSPICSQSLGFSGGCGNSTGKCIFQLQYGDGSVDAGYLSVDTFHLSRNMSESFVFGCAVITIETVPIPISGIMGLNAGPYSFTSQLFSRNANLPRRFAYCLPDRFLNLNAEGTMLFGEYKIPTRMTQYTPLVPPYGPLGDLYYFVDLEGISVGKKFIKGPVMNTGLELGGTIFDSGTAVTHLMRPLYLQLLAEVRRQTTHLHPFAVNGTASDLCYTVPLQASQLPKMPVVTMHFRGGAELELGAESLLYAYGYDNNSIVLCLAFLSTQTSLSINIIGNYQQQNYWVEYDLESSSIGLSKAKCPVRS